MRKLFPYFLLLCLISVCACSKDDSSQDPNQIASFESLLQGDWVVSSSAYNFYDVNNTVVWHEDDLDKGLKISIKGNRMEQLQNGESAIIPFVIDSSQGISKLIFDEGDNVYDTAFIIKLNKSSLVWSFYKSPDSYEANEHWYDADHSIVTDNFVKD